MTKRVRNIALATTAVGVLAGGGGAIAGASGGGSEQDPKPPAADATRATQAALASTGGGRANNVELDGENGATYEVEVTKPDGSTVDVRLDGAFKVVTTEADSGG